MELSFSGDFAKNSVGFVREIIQNRLFETKFNFADRREIDRLAPDHRPCFISSRTTIVSHLVVSACRKSMNDKMDSVVVERDTVLEQALRIYEESERSLKAVCQTIEEENNQFEDELKQLQIHQCTLLKQRHSIKEHLHHIRGEHARLAERQLILDQQTQQIDQRYDQLRSALRTILWHGLFSKSNTSLQPTQCYDMLALKLIKFDGEHRSTVDVGTSYELPESYSSKRKLSTTNEHRSSQYNHKHHRTNSSQRSLK